MPDIDEINQSQTQTHGISTQYIHLSLCIYCLKKPSHLNNNNPCQQIISLTGMYLSDCASKHRHLRQGDKAQSGNKTNEKTVSY
jgi:hypothetical protein